MENTSNRESNIFAIDTSAFFSGVSVDCVIIGFHDKHLKILLNKFHYNDQWMLPGGFVFKGEDVDAAAYRILSTRTGLKNVYLRQFHTFGDADRIKLDQNTKMLQKSLNNTFDEHWFLQRFISISYYALVEYSRANILVDIEEEEAKWFSLDDIPALYSDHNKILEKARDNLRQHIDYIPFCYELLPEKFSLSDLRIIYEVLLGKSLDRRNFQRKILSSNLIEKTEEIRKNRGSRPTALYSFNKEQYREVFENGIPMVNW